MKKKSITQQMKDGMNPIIVGPLKDSGKREHYDSGMIREPNNGRGRYDLISPIALLNLAIHYERGAVKYLDRNWEKGGPLSKHLNSAMRHLQQFLEGDRSEDHIIACAWNCFAISHNMEMIKRGVLPKELNDLPNYTIKERKKR
jgi:hypothetical protein